MSLKLRANAIALAIPQGGTMGETVRVRQRGTLTLPAKLREKYRIEEGDTFRLVDIDKDV